MLLLDVALHNITGSSAAIILPAEGISLVLENVTLNSYDSYDSHGAADDVARLPHSIVSAGSESWVGVDNNGCVPLDTITTTTTTTTFRSGGRDGNDGGGGWKTKKKAASCYIDRWAGFGGQGPHHNTPNGVWIHNELQKAPRQRLPGAREQALPNRARPWFDHLTLAPEPGVSLLDVVRSNGSSNSGSSSSSSSSSSASSSSSSSSTWSSSAAVAASSPSSSRLGSANTICNAVAVCGAKGNNLTDDTYALQRCFHKCSAVFLPSGIYKCTDTLKLNASTVLVGEALTQLYVEG